MKTNLLRTALAIGAMVILMPALARAYDESSGPERRHHGPPPEAITACEGKNVGDEVQFETPSGRTITGICRERDGQLFAIPEGGRPPRHEREQE